MKYLFLIIGIIVFLTVFITGTQISNQIDNPKTCSQCHENEYNTYIYPKNNSLISYHKLDCIECHTNSSIKETKKIIFIKLIQNKTNKTYINLSYSELKPNCKRCHLIKRKGVHLYNNSTTCNDCHLAHKEFELINETFINRNIITSGFHKNKTCQFCHGTKFEIPRCVKCHSGHGGQKLENKMCLRCHINPHIPIKPGILPNNTVNFTGKLPFKVCKPCHTKEYFDLMNSLSKHISMQTCTKCHTKHGKKPKCNNCHTLMMIDRHPSYFTCSTCHKTFKPVKVRCTSCHGKTHSWSPFTAIINPQ